MTNNSDAKKSKRKKLWKIIGAICFVIGILWMICDGMEGVEKAEDWHGPNSAIELVKNGHIEGYVEKTVGEMVEGFFGNARWESGTSSSGETMVDIRGKITYGEEPAEGLLQFRVDEEAETFEINAFEINGVGQERTMIGALVEEMYK